MPDFPEIPQSLKDAAGGRKEVRSSLANVASGWGMAMDFVGTILACWLIGFGIDWWQKTSPWGSLVGLGVGFAYAIYRILKQSALEDKRK